MTLLAALAGAAIVGGLVLLAAELLRRAPPPGTPPARRVFGRPMSSGLAAAGPDRARGRPGRAGDHPVAGGRAWRSPPASSSCPS